MPTSPSAVNPQLQLVNIPSKPCDWAKTTAYAETLRATRYRATRAETDYAELSGRVAQTLNAVGLTADAVQRLKLVENARKTLAEWPATHYNYRLDEIGGDARRAGRGDTHLRSTSGADSSICRSSPWAQRRPRTSHCCCCRRRATRWSRQPAGC